jgi:hypothetical protein
MTGWVAGCFVAVIEPRLIRLGEADSVTEPLTSAFAVRAAVEAEPVSVTFPGYEPGARWVVSTRIVMLTDPFGLMVLVGAVALSQFPPLAVVTEMVNVVGALPVLVRVAKAATTPAPEPFDNVTVEGLTPRISPPLVTVRGRDVVALSGGLLLSLTVKETRNVPTEVGVPIMPPVVNVNPGGSPAVDQV